MDSTTDPACQQCSETPYMLDCSVLSQTRLEIFGRHDLNIDVLTTAPQRVIALAGRTVHPSIERVLACVKVKVNVGLYSASS